MKLFVGEPLLTALGVFCALVLVGAPGMATGSELPTPDPSPTAVAALPDRGSRMSVPVTINGQGPFRFVVDTGSDHTAVSRRLASALQLPAAGSATMHSIAGATRVEMVRIGQLQISSKVVTNLRAVALEEADLGAEGLIGINSLSAQQVTLNFRSNTMTVGPGRKRSAPDADPDGVEVVIVRAKPYSGQLVVSDARIGKMKVRIVIDTGAAVTVANPELKRQLERRRTAVPGVAELTSADGQRLFAELLVVPELTIGDLRLRNLPVAFLDAHPFRVFRLEDTPAMLLGMDVMSKLDEVSVDFLGRTVRFVLAREAGSTPPSR